MNIAIITTSPKLIQDYFKSTVLNQAILNKSIKLHIIDIRDYAEGKKNKRQINGNQLYNEINIRIKNKSKKEIAVVVEKVSAMPGQGVTSMFNFGQSFGVIKGICSAMQLPIHFVSPAKWKKYFNLIKTEKDASRTKITKNNLSRSLHEY